MTRFEENEKDRIIEQIDRECMREKEEVSKNFQKYFKHNLNVGKFKMVNEERSL